MVRSVDDFWLNLDTWVRVTDLATFSMLSRWFARGSKKAGRILISGMSLGVALADRLGAVGM